MSQAGALTGGARREQALLAQQEASDIQEIARFMMMRLGDMETRQLMNEILRELRLRRQPIEGFTMPTIPEYTPISEWYGRQRGLTQAQKPLAEWPKMPD